MEKQLSFILKLSLEELALRRVVTCLFMGKDILDTIANFRNEGIPHYAYADLRVFEKEYKEEWQVTVENKVKDNVLELVMPETLKNRMMHVIRPIGLQIQDWKISMNAYLADFNIRILKQLCWTSTGAIDYAKTAANHVHLETLDVAKRFKLACLFCLTDSIPVIWEELPKKYKKNFNDERKIKESYEMRMEFYWACFLKGEASKLDQIRKRVYPSSDFTSEQIIFESSACHGNKEAAEYFFQKLTCGERDVSLFDTVCEVVDMRCLWNPFFETFESPVRNLSSVLYYLLSVMTPEKRMQVCKEKPKALACFLDWPWQDLFLEFADVIWAVPGLECTSISYLLHKFMMDSGYYFPNLVQEFFRRMPENFRHAFLPMFLVVFHSFSYAEDSETIKVVLRNVVLEDRARLFSSKWFLELLRQLILSDKWHLVGLCLREAALSKEQREKLKEAIYEVTDAIFKPGRELVCKRSRLMRCFELLDETEASAPNDRSS